MTYRRQSLGILGEDLACRELRRRGYEILERRYRTRFGEIDIVAREGGYTVFVEVKTRDGAEFGDGAEAITVWKQRRVAHMAVDYIARNDLHDRPCRFDVVVVTMTDGASSVEAYPHGFAAPGRCAA